MHVVTGTVFPWGWIDEKNNLIYIGVVLGMELILAPLGVPEGWMWVVPVLSIVLALLAQYCGALYDSPAHPLQKYWRDGDTFLVAWYILIYQIVTGMGFWGLYKTIIELSKATTELPKRE
jgi:hypothetical protein